MALESSGSTKPSRSDWPSKLGEFYGEFLSGQSSRSRPVDLGVTAGSMNGVFFGQRAPLTLSSPQMSVKAAESPKRQWKELSSLSFSNLATQRDSSSSLRLSPAPASTHGMVSGDEDCVETDLARSHPNSAVNNLFPRSRSIFNEAGTLKPQRDIPDDPLEPFIPPFSKNGPQRTKITTIPDMTPYPFLLPGSISKPASLLLPAESGTSSSPHTPSPTSSPTYSHLTLSSHFNSHPSSGVSSVSDYDLVDTLVSFRDPETNSSHTGTVVKVSSDKIALVKDNSSGKTRKVKCSALRLVQPSAKDVVKVVYPNNKILGKTGTLHSIIGDHGIVQFKAPNGAVGRNLAQIKLSHLGKYVKPPEPPTLTSVSEQNGTAGDPKSVWGSAVLCGTKIPFAPFAIPTLATVPFQLPTTNGATTSYPVFSNPFNFSSVMTSSSGVDLSSSVTSARTSTDVHSSSKNPKTGMPLSFQICPGSGSKHSLSALFSKPISRGGSDGVVVGGSESGVGDSESVKTGSMFRRSSSSGGPQTVSEIIERLLAHQKRYRMQKEEDDSNLDVKASCVRVSLICPISQRRLKYPSRGFQCKHLQCFDAEAYILVNLNHKPKARMKQANGRSLVQPVPTKKWQCPICLKHVHESRLYIDKSLMSVIKDLSDTVTEVELNENGTWQPYKKVVTEVIDLTADDD